MPRSKKPTPPRPAPQPETAGWQGDPTDAAAGDTSPPRPTPELIVAESVIVSPKGTRFRVLHTRERDAYDEPPADTPMVRRR